jgi:hypothetical protein
MLSLDTVGATLKDGYFLMEITRAIWLPWFFFQDLRSPQVLTDQVIASPNYPYESLIGYNYIAPICTYKAVPEELACLFSLQMLRRQASEL